MTITTTIFDKLDHVTRLVEVEATKLGLSHLLTLGEPFAISRAGPSDDRWYVATWSFSDGRGVVQPFRESFYEREGALQLVPEIYASQVVEALKRTHADLDRHASAKSALRSTVKAEIAAARQTGIAIELVSVEATAQMARVPEPECRIDFIVSVLIRGTNSERRILRIGAETAEEFAAYFRSALHSERRAPSSALGQRAQDA